MTSFESVSFSRVSAPRSKYMSIFDVNHICSASGMNISIFMTLVILSFASNQVQASLISGAPTEVHQNLVHCITVISDRNFRLDGTLMISVNECTGLEGHKLGHFLMCKNKLL